MKFFVIILLVGFLFFKLLNLFFRVLIGGSATDKSGNRNYQNHQYQSRKSTDGNVNIDYVPGDNGSKNGSKTFKGGEYVDYEEIK